MCEFKLKFLPVLVVAATVAGAVEITPSMRGTINRVDVGRQEIDQRGGKLVQEANALFADGKYMAAKDKYLKAIKEYDKYSTGVFAERSDFCRKRISDCYFREAEQAMRRADELSHASDYDEAIKTCRTALEYCDSAQKAELNRRIAIYENRRDNVAERDSVSQERLLPKQKDQEYQVQVLMEQGRKLAHNKEYVRASRKFQEVILINPFNTDALQCLSAVNEKIKEIGVDKYKTLHRRWIGETEWKNAIPYQSADEQVAKNLITAGDAKPKPEVRGDALRKRLAAIKLDRVSLQEVTVADAVDYLRAEAAKKDPEKRGVNIVFLRSVKGKKAIAATENRQNGEENGGGDAGGAADNAGDGAGDAGDGGQPQNNPLAGVVEKPDEQISLEVKGKSLLEVIETLCSSTKDPKMRFQIDDNAVLISPENFDLGGMLTKSLRLVLSEDATDEELKNGMIAEGIEFRPGAGVAYFPSLGRVVIKNDSKNLALMEAYLEGKSAGGSGALIQVQIKLIEIAQDDLDELAFNWQYQVNTNQSYYTDGKDHVGPLSSGPRQLTQTAILQPSSNELLRYYVQDNLKSTLLDDSNYSFIWANSDGTKISAHMSALDWADSKDVLASPRITTVPGHTAQIKMVTKRYFPDDWENIDIDTPAYGPGFNGFVITAASPQPDLSKEKELGVTFTIKPELVGTDMIKIPLHFPIETFADEWVTYDYRTGEDDDDDDYISMPVFNKRTFNTTVMLHDGETIVFGGVNKDDTTLVSDKIPILGDLPILGRFFQSKYSDSSKANLLVFITARLVKPDGSAFFPERKFARGVPEFGKIE